MIEIDYKLEQDRGSNIKTYGPKLFKNNQLNKKNCPYSIRAIHLNIHQGSGYIAASTDAAVSSSTQPFQTSGYV